MPSSAKPALPEQDREQEPERDDEHADRAAVARDLDPPAGEPDAAPGAA